ncbi:MAG: lytic transglycosylase domain-containing protein [Candidatus Desulfacyla sp.]
MKDNSGYTKRNMRLTVRLFRTDSRHSLGSPRLWTTLFASLIFVVFSGNALAMSLKFKLEMLGYNEHEISAILSGRESRADIDRKIKMKMLCLNVPPPPLPLDNTETKALKETAVRPNLEKPEFLPFIENLVTTQSRLLEREKQYLPIIQTAAKRTRIDESLLMAVIKVESNFDPEAVSPKGAMGLMQLMPSTASSLGVANPFNPTQNVHAGAEYLSQCIYTFQDMELALAAYNAGPHLVGQLKKVPPYPETRDFIRNVFLYRKIYDGLL